MRILYTPYFLRCFHKLEKDLKEEVKEKIELFKNKENHEKLKVHKLKGRLENRYSFSVNYKFRIVFKFLSENKTLFLNIGDHDIYK